MLSLLFFDFFDDFLGVSESEPAGESLGVTSLLQQQTRVLNRPQHNAQMPNICLRYVSGQNKEETNKTHLFVFNAVHKTKSTYLLSLQNL